MNSIASIGFIGLGVMGTGMCANLVAKSGLPVVGFDHDPAAIARQGGANFAAAGSLLDIAARVDVLFLCLPSVKQVVEVLRGPEGILAHRGRVRTIIDMSTSAVRETRALAADAQAAGITYLDAPVARLREAARLGTLSIMVGGPVDAFEKVRPLLACMGTDITHCGAVGAGQVVKILNNMTVFITAHALAEALAIGRRAGVDGELLFNTMALGSSDSFVLRHQGMKHLVKDHFPQNAFPTDYALKDIDLALELARDGSIDAQLTATTRALLARTRDAGYARDYYPIMLRLIEAGTPTARA
ncbi:MAG: NAD(P)-dependent oxidoreductase [Burkholderiales bacterium]|nr:NAD(P)-dependent oxidoreductase [Burkholderiales bacterium]